jgi:uncharacterized protein (TIGR00369 family)
MNIWKKHIDVKKLTDMHIDTAVQHAGIEFLEVGENFIRARVPVDKRTRQPYGLLHGGISILLAEAIGSCGAHFSCPEEYISVGLDINANHLRSAKTGWVTAKASPVNIGRSTHVWHIELHNESGELICISRLTMAILKATKESI